MTTANRFSALFKTPTKIPLTDDKSSYTNAFPSLGEAKKAPVKLDLELVSDLEIKPKIDIDVKASSSAKKTVTKIILGPRSYEEQLSFDRTGAYELLADKEKLASSLAKTRMCNSVDKNEQCVHGDSCRFAHNLTELKISTCIFEDRCRFVRMWNGKLYNNGDKICNHKHTQENTEDFMSRVGLDRYNKQKSKETLLPSPTQAQFVPPPQAQFIQPPPPTQAQFVPPPPQAQFVQPPPQAQFFPPPPPQAQFFQPPPPTQAQFVQPPPQAQFFPPPPPTQAHFVPPPPPTQAQFVPPLPTQAQFVPPPLPTQAQFVQAPPPTQAQFVQAPQHQQQNDSVLTQTSTEQILVIRVPKELASQALEIAMKSGRTHIQVDII